MSEEHIDYQVLATEFKEFCVEQGYWETATPVSFIVETGEAYQKVVSFRGEDSIEKYIAVYDYKDNGDPTFTILPADAFKKTNWNQKIGVTNA